MKDFEDGRTIQSAFQKKHPEGVRSRSGEISGWWQAEPYSKTIEKKTSQIQWRRQPIRDKKKEEVTKS